MLASPLVYTEHGKTKACGLRVVVAGRPLKAGQVGKYVDTSVNFYPSRVAVGKVIGLTGMLDPSGTLHSKRLPLYGVWWKLGASVLAPLGQAFTPGPESGAYVYQVSFTTGVDVVLGLERGEPLQIAVKWNRGNELIYSGTVRMEPEEWQVLGGCLGDLVKTIKSEGAAQ